MTDQHKTRSRNVNIAIRNESVILGKPATVSVYEKGQLVAEITAEIKNQRGADGGWYPSVTFKNKYFD